MTDTTPRELAGRWQPGIVLKRDTFSTIERGQFTGAGGPVDAVLRRTDGVAWWVGPLARHFLRREARGLSVAGRLGVSPPLLHAGRRVLVRGFLHGTALHVAKPVGDVAYFRAAKRALRQLHHAGICHNDLAKEQNWLRGPDGEAYMTDFQLAARLRRGSWLHKIAAYEDLRHLLKHKRRYVPDALTATERRVLARKSFLTRAWMASGKKIYWTITRGLKLEDREGGGTRASRDVPEILAQLRGHPHVCDAVMVVRPKPDGKVWLYAFVEADGVTEADLHDLLHRTIGPDKAPEHIQVAVELPRRADGDVRMDILHLIPQNQVGELDRLAKTAEERRIIAALLANRKEFGHGPRQNKDAPAIADCLKRHIWVRDAAVIAFPHQRLRTALYAFVEAKDIDEDALRDYLNGNLADKRPPELMQIVAALPRDPQGTVRADILQDIAMNEMDRLGAWSGTAEERRIIKDILAGRKNVHDL